MEVRVKDRPELLVDVGEQVREDLLIDPSPPALAAQSLAGGSALAGGGALAPRGVLASAITKAAVTGRAITRAAIRPPSPELIREVALKIRSVLPPGGDIVCTLVPEEAEVIGGDFTNWHDQTFWLGSENHLHMAIDEWMNGEYEWICERFYEWEGGECDFGREDESDHPRMPHPSLPERFLVPELDSLLNAWDSVARGMPDGNHSIPMEDRSGTPLGYHSMTSGELMGYFGVSEEAIWPQIVVAERLLQEDLDDILQDEEVTLSEGYQVTEVATIDDLTRITIQPKPN